MRLGQLARKVSIHSSEIVEFLSKQNITIEDGNNSRVSDEHVKLVYERYAPELLLTPEAEVRDEVVPPNPVQTVVINENISVEETPIEQGSVIIDEIQEPTYEVEINDDVTEELPDVIKAPKVELKGLTVLGKIELPSAKSKETPIEPSESSENPEPGVVADLPSPAVVSPRKKHVPRENDRRSAERPRKNPVAAQREREQREADERRKEEKIRQKEQRTQYYQNRVKPSVPTKAVRIIDDPQMYESETVTRDRPKTIWGRFVRWLTT